LSIYLRNALLWDGLGTEPAQADVAITDGRVRAVLPAGTTADDDALVVDLDGAFVMPGLVDMHVHLVWSGGPDPAAVVGAAGEQTTTIRAFLNARAQLEAGITTVRDLGSNWDIAVTIGGAVDRADLDGPTIVASGRTVIMTGGHDPFWGIFSDGQAGVVRAVRHQAMIGAGVINPPRPAGCTAAPRARTSDAAS